MAEVDSVVVEVAVVVVVVVTTVILCDVLLVCAKFVLMPMHCSATIASSVEMWTICRTTVRSETTLRSQKTDNGCARFGVCRNSE